MTGGGLPTGRITLRQPRNGAPMSGMAQFAPYTRRARAWRWPRSASPRAATVRPSSARSRSSTARFPDGRVRALRLPISGRLGSGGSFAFGTACAEVRFAFLQTGSLQLGPTRLPVCPVGSAMISKPAGGDVRFGAQLRSTVLNGRLGNRRCGSPRPAAGSSARSSTSTGSRCGLAAPDSPIVFDAARLNGTFVGQGAQRHVHRRQLDDRQRRCCR